ncbi:MAG: pyrrolysine--tRNA(Pyl) ligase large subunit [bacterium]
MRAEFTEAQKKRLRELGLRQQEIPEGFADTTERDKSYKELEKKAVADNRKRLEQLLEEEHLPKLCALRRKLEEALCRQGFTEVTTPVIISKKFLDRMTIDAAHPLHEQVFWLDNKSCLRPMLAPNLYDVSKSLLNFAKKPLRIFEIGSCFRKESEGSSHLKEFTMLNLVEWGTPLEKRSARLKEMAEMVLQAAEIADFAFIAEDSVVYGQGLDIVAADTGLELASTSMGPHPLDAAWKIRSSWTGLGFGLERLLMHREKAQGIHRYSKSIAYLDGATLKIK